MDGYIPSFLVFPLGSRRSTFMGVGYLHL
jgi:hypothetical protein